MAFTSESPRKLGLYIKPSPSGSLGPGQYYNEGYHHRIAMETIYPKKQVPFNSNSSRFEFSKSEIKPIKSPGKF